MKWQLIIFFNHTSDSHTSTHSHTHKPMPSLFLSTLPSLMLLVTCYPSFSGDSDVSMAIVPPLSSHSASFPEWASVHVNKLVVPLSRCGYFVADKNFSFSGINDTFLVPGSSAGMNHSAGVWSVRTQTSRPFENSMAHSKPCICVVLLLFVLV